jgi:hypothetical protein
MVHNLLNLFLEGFKLVGVILDLGRVVFNAVEGQLLDFQAVVLYEKWLVRCFIIVEINCERNRWKILTSSLRFLSSLVSLLTCELLIFKPSRNQVMKL